MNHSSNKLLLKYALRDKMEKPFFFSWLRKIGFKYQLKTLHGAGKVMGVQEICVFEDVSSASRSRIHEKGKMYWKLISST